MACKMCGKDVNVLRETDNPSHTEYIGICKECIQKDLESKRAQKQKEFKEFKDEFEQMDLKQKAMILGISFIKSLFGK